MNPAPPVGRHGGDGGRLAAALGIAASEVLDLSASLNPVAPDPATVISRHLDALARYPDPARATAALAEAIGVDESQLLLTNGGAEAIALVAAELGGYATEPEFGLYARHLPPSGGGGRWRSNPHNPTGLLAPTDATAAVWDEAFWPLATGTWTRGDTATGALVLGSLTKLIACPGLRIGYVLSSDAALIGRLRERQPQWAVNGLVCEALPELLETVDLAGWAKETADLRSELGSLLRNHGLEPRPSDANWLLVDAPGLRDRLAAHAILIRDCTSFGMPGTFRLAVPGPEGLERLDRALAQTERAR